MRPSLILARPVPLVVLSGSRSGNCRGAPQLVLAVKGVIGYKRDLAMFPDAAAR